MANRQENLRQRLQFLWNWVRELQNRMERHRQRDVEQGNDQGIEMQALQPWKPPTELDIGPWGEYRRQLAIKSQPGGYQYPQMISGWLWKSHANQLLGGPFQYKLGDRTHVMDPRRPSDMTYQIFKDYDQISKNLRDLAPDDKAVGDEDEEKFRSAGIEFGTFIGGGSYGKVFHATVTQPDGTQKSCVVKRLAFADFKDKQKSTEYAIKSIVREVRAAKKILEALEREEQAAGLQTSYPPVFNKNIIGVDTVWRIYQGETQFPDPISILLFMEVCDTDLAHVIQRPIPDNTKLTEDDARKLFVQIGNALKWLHGIGIVHYDIKPDNILIKFDPADPTRGQFKLGDFGLCEVFSDPRNMMSNLNRGTQLYKAPELYNKKKITADSRLTDVYSLGSTAVMSMVGFGDYKMYGGDLKAYYTDHCQCMHRFEFDLIKPFDVQDMHVLDSYGFNYPEIVAFFRMVCTENLNFRAQIDEALNLQWAQRWQYQPGFVDLECLVARQQLMQQQANIQAQQQAQQQQFAQQLQQAFQQALLQQQTQQSSQVPSSAVAPISSSQQSYTALQQALQQALGQQQQQPGTAASSASYQSALAFPPPPSTMQSLPGSGQSAAVIVHPPPSGLQSFAGSGSAAQLQQSGGGAMAPPGSPVHFQIGGSSSASLPQQHQVGAMAPPGSPMQSFAGSASSLQLQQQPGGAAPPASPVRFQIGDSSSQSQA